MFILTSLCGFLLLFLHENNWPAVIVCVLLCVIVCVLCYLHLSPFRYTCSASDISIHHPMNKFHTNTSVLPLMLSAAPGQVPVKQLTHPFPEMSHNTTELGFWPCYILFPSSNWISCPVIAKYKSWMALCQSVLGAFLWSISAPSSNFSSVFLSKKFHVDNISSVAY